MTDERRNPGVQATDVWMLPDDGGDPGDRVYLMVFEGRSSSVFQLPRTGEVVIGRAKGVDLQLGDPSVSRKHVRIMVTDGVATVRDLGSHNGTFVNGERLGTIRTLISGDVISVCSVSLVFHANLRARAPRILIDADALRELLEGEVARATSYGRPFSVLAIGAFASGTDRADIASLLEKAVRPLDRMAWSDGGHAYMVLPETGPEAVGQVARRVLDAVANQAGARVGYACCPRDGSSVDAVLSAARAALGAASEGQALSSEQAFRTQRVGDRQVILADEAMVRVYALIERLASSDIPVLVCGETGTGKESAASAVHHFSDRRDKPLVTLNCAALQEQLVESELFGHEKGAFTGAVATKPGMLETATGGTVFLDEIGELSPAIQAKLLRAIEIGRFTRLGATVEREVDVRFVGATHRDLRAEVAAGRFREDLYFRLGAATVWLPPLRDRKREIPILAQSFLASARQRTGQPAMELSAAALQVLGAYAWPGNIRELRNIMEYLAATERGAVVDAEPVRRRLEDSSGVITPPPTMLPTPAPTVLPASASAGRTFRPLKDEVAELERTRIREALAAADGNQTHAARLIGVPLRTFVSKMKKYDLR